MAIGNGDWDGRLELGIQNWILGLRTENKDWGQEVGIEVGELD